MTKPTSRQLQELLKRYRADLEEVNRRIRIVEWLARGQHSRNTKRQSA